MGKGLRGTTGSLTLISTGGRGTAGDYGVLDMLVFVFRQGTTGNYVPYTLILALGRRITGDYRMPYILILTSGQWTTGGATGGYGVPDMRFLFWSSNYGGTPLHIDFTLWAEDYGRLQHDLYVD